MRCGSYSLRPGPLDCCARCTVAPPGVLKARGTQHPRLCALLQIRATLPPCWGECAWARLGHAEHHVPGAPLLAERRPAQVMRGKQARGWECWCRGSPPHWGPERLGGVGGPLPQVLGRWGPERHLPAPAFREQRSSGRRAGGEQVRCFSDKCLVILKAVCALTCGFISLQKGCD